MKFIIDSSVFGAAYYHNQAKTGIFRVAEQILLGVVNSPEIEEVAAGAYESLPDAMLYFENEAQLKKIQFVNTDADIRLAKMENTLMNLFPKNSLPQKGLARAMGILKFRLKHAHHFSPEKMQNYDIFHSPFHPFAAEVQQMKSLKKVITVYDLIPKLFPQYFGEWNKHNMNRILDCIKDDTHVICISECTKNDLCDAMKISPEQISVVPLAASKDKFYPCKNDDQIKFALEKYKIPNQKYLLSLSTLEPRKNIERTIRAFLHLIQQEHIQDLNLVLVGTKGWDFDTIFDEIKGNDAIKARIIVTGYMDDKDLAPIYSRALGFVYPSLYEGFGLPPLEAMQCGTPVISSRNSSIPEVVGDAGILLDPTDENAIADAMLQIYKDENLRKTLSQKSFEQAKNFTWEKFQAEHLAIYKAIL